MNFFLKKEMCFVVIFFFGFCYWYMNENEVCAYFSLFFFDLWIKCDFFFAFDVWIKCGMNIAAMKMFFFLNIILWEWFCYCCIMEKISNECCTNDFVNEEMDAVVVCLRLFFFMIVNMKHTVVKKREMYSFFFSMCVLFVFEVRKN